jgi:hypothetical protein
LIRLESPKSVNLFLRQAVAVFMRETKTGGSLDELAGYVFNGK